MVSVRGGEVIDVDALTRPFAQGKPCGDNLEYHPDFQALEWAALGKPEQQSGGRDGRPIVVPAEPPAWDEVRQRALGLFERTRDLRVAVLFTRALARTEGLQGLATGLAVLEGLVASLWDEVHPRLDPDDNDPVMRINALAALIDPEGLIRDLRAATFVSDPRGGRCTVRQLEIALGLAEASDEPAIPRPQIEAMLREAAAAGLADEASRAIAHAKRLAELLAERAGSAGSIDLEPLLRRLRPLAAFYRETVPAAAGDAAAATGLDSAAGGGRDLQGVARTNESGAQASGSLPLGEIRNRDDVVRLLGKICDYLERTEPTNPAPLLIRRAQRLMAMNFVDILRDLAPEGVPAVTRIAGLEPGSS